MQFETVASLTRRRGAVCMLHAIATRYLRALYLTEPDSTHILLILYIEYHVRDCHIVLAQDKMENCQNETGVQAFKSTPRSVLL